MESSHSFLLLNELQTRSQASAACEALGEKLIAFVDTEDFRPLLVSYLNENRFGYPQRIWVETPAGSCTVYSLDSNTTQDASCDGESQPACTNTAKYQGGYKVPSTDLSVFVNTTQGRVKGFRDRLTARFQGIPYAKPPVGELRLINPERMETLPVQTSDASYDATEFKPI